MLIADLIRKSTFKEVNQKIQLHYGAENSEKYEKLFINLKEKSNLPV